MYSTTNFSYTDFKEETSILLEATPLPLDIITNVIKPFFEIPKELFEEEDINDATTEDTFYNLSGQYLESIDYYTNCPEEKPEEVSIESLYRLAAIGKEEYDRRMNYRKNRKLKEG